MCPQALTAAGLRAASLVECPQRPAQDPESPAKPGPGSTHLRNTAGTRGRGPAATGNGDESLTVAHSKLPTRGAASQDLAPLITHTRAGSTQSPRRGGAYGEPQKHLRARQGASETHPHRETRQGRGKPCCRSIPKDVGECSERLLSAQEWDARHFSGDVVLLLIDRHYL